MLAFHAVGGRGGKNEFWWQQISSQHFDLLLWRAVGGEGSSDLGRITLTSAGPLTENQQKQPGGSEGGRKEKPQGRGVPKHTGEVDHMAPTRSINSAKECPSDELPIYFCFTLTYKDFISSPEICSRGRPGRATSHGPASLPLGADPTSPPRHCLALGPLQFHSCGLDSLHTRAIPLGKESAKRAFLSP